MELECIELKVRISLTYTIHSGLNNLIKDLHLACSRFCFSLETNVVLRILYFRPCPDGSKLEPENMDFQLKKSTMWVCGTDETGRLRFGYSQYSLQFCQANVSAYNTCAFSCK